MSDATCEIAIGRDVVMILSARDEFPGVGSHIAGHEASSEQRKERQHESDNSASKTHRTHRTQNSTIQ